MRIQTIATIQAVEESPNPFCIQRTTSATSFGSISRIYIDYSYPFSYSFVFNKFLKLVETPAIKPFIFSSLFTPPYILDSFHNDCISSFELGNNRFRDFMIEASFKPFLPARKLFKMPLGRGSAFSLKLRTKSLKSEYLFSDFSIRKESFIRGCSKIVNSDVYTDNFTIATLVDRDIFGNRNIQKHPFLFIINQISRANLPIKIFSIIFGNLNRCLYSPFNRTERNLIFLKAKASCIISYCEIFFKSWLRTLIPENRFKSFTSFISTATYKLGGKLGKLSNFIVSQIMEPFLITYMFFKTNIHNFLSRLRVLLHSFKKYRISWNFYLHCSNGFHIYLIVKQIFKYLPQFLLWLKPEVSLRCHL